MDGCITDNKSEGSFGLMAVPMLSSSLLLGLLFPHMIALEGKKQKCEGWLD